MRNCLLKTSKNPISGKRVFASNGRFKEKNNFEISDELGNSRKFMDSQVKVEQIMDQKDIVDERQQNIREITDMMTKVNQISKEMNQLIQKQDDDLDNIHKKQEDIQNNAQTTVKDMVEADNITKKKLKKIAFWAAAVILLGLCIVGLVYILKGKKTSDDPKKTTLSLTSTSEHPSYYYDPIANHLDWPGSDHLSSPQSQSLDYLITEASLI
jgi:hypothetical protein